MPGPCEHADRKYIEAQVGIFGVEITFEEVKAALQCSINLWLAARHDVAGSEVEKSASSV